MQRTMSRLETFSEWIFKAGLLPIEGEDYSISEVGFKVLHSGRFPLSQKPHEFYTPAVGFVLGRQDWHPTKYEIQAIGGVQ